MQIHSLISQAVQEVTSPAIMELAEKQIDSAVRDVLLQVADKIHEVQQLIASGSLTTVVGNNGMKPAVFVAKRLDGVMHVGWHHTPVDTAAGDTFHYDHGIAIEKNQDGQYIWFAPITAYVNFTFNAETNTFDGAWESCLVDTNATSKVSIYERALTKALERKIATRPPIVYVTLSSPIDIKQPIEVRRFQLGY